MREKGKTQAADSKQFFKTSCKSWMQTNLQIEWKIKCRDWRGLQHKGPITILDRKTPTASTGQWILDHAPLFWIFLNWVSFHSRSYISLPLMFKLWLHEGLLRQRLHCCSRREIPFHPWWVTLWNFDLVDSACIRFTYPSSIFYS